MKPIVDAADLVIPPIRFTEITDLIFISDNGTVKLNGEELPPAKQVPPSSGPYCALPICDTPGGAGIPPTPKAFGGSDLTEDHDIVCEFFSKLNSLRDDTEKALEYIFDVFDEMLLEGYVFVCNEILKVFKVEDFSIEVLIGVLTITAQHKGKLSAWISFLREVKYQTRLIYSEEETTEMLKGLH